MRGYHILQVGPVQPLAKAGKPVSSRGSHSWQWTFLLYVPLKRFLSQLATKGNGYGTYFWLVWVSIPAGPVPSPVRALPAGAPDLCWALHRSSRADLAVPWDAGGAFQPGDTALQGARRQRTPQHAPSWVQKQCTGEWLPAGRQEELPKG